MFAPVLYMFSGISICWAQRPLEHSELDWVFLDPISCYLLMMEYCVVLQEQTITILHTETLTFCTTACGQAWLLTAYSSSYKHTQPPLWKTKCIQYFTIRWRCSLVRCDAMVLIIISFFVDGWKYVEWIIRCRVSWLKGCATPKFNWDIISWNISLPC